MPGQISRPASFCCPRPQAVVNERVDYKTLHAEMVAALESHDRKSSLLEASLLEKDAQLEAVQARLLVSGRRRGGWGVRCVRPGGCAQRRASGAHAACINLDVARAPWHASPGCPALRAWLTAAPARPPGLLLQQEQAEAVRMAEELRREREGLEAERQRLLAEQQAALEAEAQHKQQLLQRLEARSQEAQDAAVQHEAERQRLLGQLAEQAQQLEAARASAEAAAAAHAAALVQQQEAAAAEAALLVSRAEERAAAAAAEAARAAAESDDRAAAAVAEAAREAAAAKEELARTQQLLVGSREEARILTEHHEQHARELEVSSEAHMCRAWLGSQRSGSGGMCNAALAAYRA